MVVPQRKFEKLFKELALTNEKKKHFSNYCLCTSNVKNYIRKEQLQQNIYARITV